MRTASLTFTTYEASLKLKSNDPISLCKVQLLLYLGVTMT
jgi:hypothetical protein